eukprot:TRINITY_DN3790_c0_g1_i1.p2 TRINITY_DN3790_c0_g1~~TRINITY_DN3790_c0_g1_i1.p2  ORF type:complete len:66 (+),score=5.48 TRINITY_DN3790_c0_g1_i1:56-253(+)
MGDIQAWRASLRHEGREILVGFCSSEAIAAGMIGAKRHALGIKSKLPRSGGYNTSSPSRTTKSHM